MSRLHRFAQPSEVAEPIELLRAGLVFHARGLINTKAIQHNLDWVWPYWVERQFDPSSVSFIPRAFSLTHVNLTHRNWTAVGQPGVDLYPIVDPAGLVTPLFDGWSIDLWVVPDRGDPLLPSRAASIDQRLDLRGNLRVATRARDARSTLSSITDVVMSGGVPTCRAAVKAASGSPGWLVVAIRPANPEGVSFIHDLAVDPGGDGALVNRTDQLKLSEAADSWRMSRYHEGDVYQRLAERSADNAITCEVGMATGAAMFRLKPGEARSVTARVPLVTAAGGPMPERKRRRRTVDIAERRRPWREALDGLCQVDLPDGRMRNLFDAAVRSLVLHAPGDIYPGPYTYKRFWFRDAAFIGHALLNIGATDRVAEAIDLFPGRQTGRGYFRSQEGEWDSNGQAVWLIDRYHRLTGEPVSERLIRAVESAVRWIDRKRCDRGKDAPHAGLMPAGFSAEHLGPNDYYYWDDFWSVAGLRAGSALLSERGLTEAADAARRTAGEMVRAIERSIGRTGVDRDRRGVPASPYRRMDGGAIGSLAADYPTQLWPAGDRRMIDTVEFLLSHYLVEGGFFQDMIHSGVNAYLTLHLAQVLLRAGDHRHFELMENVAALASPTGQWPEAIHPLTRGGCMGDGHHVWAAAEWAMMIRNCFVREEGGTLVLGSGLPRAWLDTGRTMSLGPTPTPWGPVTVEVEPTEREVRVSWRGDWRGKPPRIDVRLPDGRAGASGRQASLVVPRGGGRWRTPAPDPRRQPNEAGVVG